MGRGEGSSRTDIPTASSGSLVRGIQLLILCGLVVLTIIALWPVQELIGSRLELLKAETIRRLEVVTGRQLTYESISPSIFHSFEIRGLKVYDTEPDHRLLLSIQQVQIYFNVFKLFSGNPVSALSEISIENSALAINTQSDHDLIEFLNRLIAESSRKAALPKKLRLSGKNLSLSVTSPNGEYAVDHLFFDLQNGEQGLRVQVRGGLAADFIGRPAGISKVATVVTVSGLVARNLQWSDLRLRFDRLSSNLVTLVRPTFHVSLRDGVWRIRKVQDKAPLDLQLSYDSNSQRLNLSFAAESFRPSYYFDLGPSLERYAPWLSSVVSGTGALSYSFRDKSLSYRSDVRLKIDNRYLPAPTSIDARFAGDRTRAEVALLSVRTSEGAGRFSGTVDLAKMIPSGSLALTDVATPLGARLSAFLTLAERNGSLVAQSNSIKLGSVSLEPVELTATPRRGRVDFQLAASFAGGVAGNSFLADGSFQYQPESYLEVAVSTHALPLAALYAAAVSKPSATLSEALQGLSLSTRAFLVSDLKRFSFLSPQTTIGSDREPGHSVSFGLSGNDKNLDVRAIKIDWGSYTGTGSVKASLVDAGRISFESNLSVQGVAYHANGYYVEGSSLVLSGNYGLDLTAIREGKRYIFRVLTNRLPLPFLAGSTELTLDLEGFYSNPTTWEVLSRGSKVTNLSLLPIRENQLALSARISATGADIYSLSLQDRISKVMGTGRITLRHGEAGYSGTGWLQLYNPDGSERYEASINFDGSKMDTLVSFTGAPLSRLGKLPITGDLTGSVALTGSILHPNVSANVTLPEGQLFSDPISGSASIRIDASRIRLIQANLRYLSHTLSQVSGQIDRDSGAFTLSGAYRGELGGDVVDASVALSGKGEPIETALSLSPLLEGSLRARATVSNVRIDGKPAAGWDFFVDHKEGRLVFSGGPSNAIDGYLLSSGNFALTLGGSLPVALHAQGTLTGSTIEASLQNVVLDLHAFDTVANIPYFDISKGKARGNLAISGPINDPEFEGDLYATGVFGKTIVIPDEIGPFSTDLAFRGKTLAMDNVTLPTGSSEVLGSLNFTIDHWAPTDFVLRFRTESRQGVHVKTPIAGLDFDGYTNGSITIQGDGINTELSGNLVVDSCVITIGRTPQEPADAASTPNNTTYDFTFTTGRRVEFVWPTLNLPILRGYADAGQLLRINADGNTGDFSIVGNINVRSGEIYYFRQSFYLQSGSISFNEDQNKIDPILNARAEVHEVDENGKNVSVYLVVNDQPLSRFSPQFISDPPLSNSQILTLLGQNVYPQLAYQQSGIGSAVNFTGDLLSNISIMRTVEQKVRDLFGLDLFSVRTQILQNIVSERVFGINPTFAATSAGSLSQYLDNTTFFLGKYLTSNIFAEAMINLRSNNAFLSAYGGATNNLAVDGEALLDINTPFFLFQWSLTSLAPTNVTQTQWIPGASLFWSLSF